MVGAFPKPFINEIDAKAIMVPKHDGSISRRPWISFPQATDRTIAKALSRVQRSKFSIPLEVADDDLVHLCKEPLNIFERKGTVLSSE